MRVRSKLAVLLAAPVCALLLLGGWGARDRLDAADQAAAGAGFIELGAATGSLTHELQQEMLLSVGSMAQVVDLTDEQLADQRQATDRAVTTFRARLAAVSPLLADETASDSLRASLDELARYREQVDAGSGDPGNFSIFYGRFAGAVADLTAELTTAAATLTPEVAGGLTSVTALTTAKSIFAEQAAILVRVFAYELGPGDLNQLVSLDGSYDTQLSVFNATATAAAQEDLRTHLNTEQAIVARRTLAAVVNQAAGSLTGGAAVWARSAATQIDALRAVERDLADDLVRSSRSLAESTASDVRLYGFVAIGAVALALVLGLVVVRSLTRPLRRLTRAAYELSRERLPALVAALRRPGDDDVVAELAPIEIDTKDEIGQLAEAFNTVQAVTGQVAEEQRALLRKGIGDTFVTLARRNQSLIDRQISFLDELEATEQDPDTLEHLFQLDHLATRMRRNAESLLVLAGVEPARRRGQAVQLADAVRAAVSEVQDFARIDLLVLDEATVDGSVAVDLAHLLAELMENATSFSPPETRVEIVGHLTRDGYVLSVTDQGIGMSDQQLRDANEILATPPMVGLSLSRSLGFIVVSRLAKRSGVSVRVTHSVAGGVTAVVTVPSAVLADSGAPTAVDAAAEPVASGPWAAPQPMPEAVAVAPAPAPAPAPAAPAVADWTSSPATADSLPQRGGHDAARSGFEPPAARPAAREPDPSPSGRPAPTPADPPGARPADPWVPAPATAAAPQPAPPAWDEPAPPAPPAQPAPAPPAWQPQPQPRPAQPPAAASVGDWAAAPTASGDDWAARPDESLAAPGPFAGGQPAGEVPAAPAAHGGPAGAYEDPYAVPWPTGTPAPPASTPQTGERFDPHAVSWGAGPGRDQTGAAPEWVPAATPPESLREAVPGGPAFDRGLAALVADGQATADPVGGPGAPGGAPPLPTRQPAQPGPHGDASALPTRAPGGRQPAPSPEQGPAAKATQRSPEEVRAMLSNYRTGLSRGRTSRFDQVARDERAGRDEEDRS